jgi:hypothetical protein
MSCLKQGAVVAVGEKPPQKEKKTTKQFEGRGHLTSRNLRKQGMVTHQDGVQDKQP